MTPAAKLHKLTELSAEEIAFNEQNKIVKKLIPKESEYLSNGVLYYRIKNQLHNSQIQELKAIEQRKMVVQQKKITRRFSNHFATRLSQRKSDVGHSSVSEMHLARNEDPHMIKATDIQYLEDVQDLKFNRLNRAVQNQFHGFTNTTNQPLLEIMKKKEIDLLQPSTGGKSSSSEKIPEEKESSQFFKSKFAAKSKKPQDSRAKEAEDVMLAERNKRKAQDMLLLNQLEAGVLPETFIKSSEDPRYVMVNLSQYGIGDVRGLCLGKWYKYFYIFFHCYSF
jgi:hypothetical protein